MPARNANIAAWVALAFGVVTMVLVAMIVRSDGPMGEVGSGEFWQVFSAVLVGSIAMIVALARAVIAQRSSHDSERHAR